jgi:long-subunit acyl-CoA synthetase (AMP-forming)
MGVPGFFETARKHLELRAARLQEKEGKDAQEALRTAAHALFGDRIRYLWTGSAPARRDTLEFFSATLRMPVFEGYGLNETCIVAKNHPGAHREGSVGKVLPRKKILFDEDGVISVYSDHPVNTRYAYAAPGESERVFQGDVVRTGDIGHLDDDGYLYIHGRADDVIVLDNGRKVIVRPVEERMKAHPAIGECVVYCPTQTHLVAVVSPAADLPAGPDDADFAALVAAHLEHCNAAAEPDERIAGTVLADAPFTVENGLLSSQFKPRRKQIAEQYSARIAAVRGRP